MIIGLILIGSGFGAVSGLTALILLGQSVWMALLIHACAGVLGVLAGAAAIALRTGDDCADPVRPHIRPHALPRPQRG